MFNLVRIFASSMPANGGITAPIPKRQGWRRYGRSRARQHKMMPAWGINNPEVNRSFPNLLATAKGVSPEFTAQLEGAIELLPDTLRYTLEAENQKIVGVRRLADVAELEGAADAILIARGKNHAGKIFVAEEHMKGGCWIKTESPGGTMRHEIGHYVNTKSGELGRLISDSDEFIAAYEKDAASMPEELRQALRPLLTRDTLAREELFSEVIAQRLGGPANIEYQGLFEKAFPEVFKVMGVKK